MAQLELGLAYSESEMIFLAKSFLSKLYLIIISLCGHTEFDYDKDAFVWYLSFVHRLMPKRFLLLVITDRILV